MPTRKLKELWRQEMARHYDLMKAQALQLSDDLDRYAAAYGDIISDLVIKYGFCVHGVVISLRSRSRQAQIIEGLGIPMSKVIRRPTDLSRSGSQGSCWSGWSESGCGEEPVDQGGFVLHTFEAVPCDPGQVGGVARGEVGHAAFQTGPDVLGRVQLRGVAR